MGNGGVWVNSKSARGRTLIARTLRGLVQLIGGLAVGLSIVIALGSWRLSTGSVSLWFLTPYVEAALSAPDKGFKIEIDETALTWAGWDRVLDIRVSGVSAVGSDGKKIVQVPELSLSLSARALAQGIIAPSSMEMFGPRLRLVRIENGQLQLGFAGTEGKTGAMFSRLFTQLSATPDPSLPLSYLKRFSIFSADLSLEDKRLGLSWQAPDAELVFIRDKEGVSGDMSLSVATEGGGTSISVIGKYRTIDKMLDIGVSFSALRPSDFSVMAPGLRALSALDMSLQGTLTFSMDIDGVVESVGFDIAGEKGHLAFPVEVAQSLGLLSLAQRVEVETLQLTGRMEGAQSGLLDRIEVADFDLVLARGETLYLPPPFDHEMPIRAVKGSGRYLATESRLEVNVEGLNLNGPVAHFSGEIDRLGWPDMIISAEGSVRDVKTDNLETYWPRSLGSDVRKWMVSALDGGALRTAHARMVLGPDETGKLSTLSLGGGLTFEDVNLSYFGPLPKVKNVFATAVFDKKNFDVSFTKGASEGLILTSGTAAFSGLDQRDQVVDIDVQVEGPIKNILKMIDRDPLNFVSTLDIDPETAEGSASTRLKINFPVEKSLTPARIKVSAQSVLKDVALHNVLFGRGLSGGNLLLNVDRQGMDIAGDVVLGNLPVKLTWRENFTDKALFKSRYDLSGRIEDVRNLGDVGLDLTSFPWEYVEGALEAEINYTVFKKEKRKLEARLDVKDVALFIPMLDWSKEEGAEGAIELTLNLEGNRLAGVPRFQITADDMDIVGSAVYGAEDGSLSRVDLKTVSFGRNKMAGVLFPRAAGGWNANIHGESFDFAPLWEHFFERDDTPEDDKPGIPFSVSADLGRVWVKGQGFLSNVSATFVHDGMRWARIIMKSELGKGKVLDLSLAAGADQNREILMTSDDAGKALKVFDIYPNVIGGRLVLSGKYDDKDADAPLKGHLNAYDFRLSKAPALIKIIGVMALTGIADALEGEGLGFSELDIPYELAEGTLAIHDAKATGASLGVTAKGTVYAPADVINLEGTIIPAYAINSLLGNIPVLGTLLTGVEEGGGMFAATYSVSGSRENPEITVNPLAALAPGILRNLFGLFGGSNDVRAGSDRPKAPSSN